MPKKRTIGIIAGTAVTATAVAAHIAKKKAQKTSYTAEAIETIPVRKMGFYEKYIKRGMDVVCATAAIVCFSPLYLGVGARREGAAQRRRSAEKSVAAGFHQVRYDSGVYGTCAGSGIA